MTAADESTPLLAEESKDVSPKKKGIMGRAIGAAGAVGEKAMEATRSAKRAGVNLGLNLGDGYLQSCTVYDKIFLKHINRDFGDHLEVASRGACFVVVCALPFVLPHEICPACEEIVSLKLYTAASITYFIYTLYVYTGDILHFAQGGITGTILAVLSIWMMQGFMPGGYTEDQPHRWTIGSIWGMVFVFLILWLNFDDNTRIFALSTYVWYWMAFLMPDANAGFAQNFQIKFNGKAMKELLVAVAGCSIAVVAGYFPYPIYAHKKAMNISRSMMDQIFMAKKDFLAYYCDAKASDRLKVRILAREMETLRSEAGSVGALLDSAWYESLGMGTWQRQRVMMAKFQDYIAHTIDLLSNAFAVGLEESFDQNHQDLMKHVKNEFDAVVENNGKVLLTCVAILNLGQTDEGLATYGREHLEASKKHLKTLTGEFRKTRASLGMDEVGEDCLGENVVGLTFSQFTEITSEFFESLQEEQVEERSWHDGGGILGIFQPAELFDKDHIIWTLRNGISIILSFYVGWHGYGQYIKMYNASIASTVAVLLSKFVGSAMTKNLARLQGVVIGIVLGNLLYALLAWCYWWGHLAVAVALYLWTLVGLFMYFHSQNYSTVGLLLVVFGSSALLRPCSNESTDPSGHGLIVNVTVAIVIMTVVDCLLSHARASELSLKAFKEAANPLRVALVELLDENKDTVTPRKGAVVGKIATAKALGAEAALEPRYWRLDWPTSNFDQGCACLSALLCSVRAIETAVLRKKNKDDAYPTRKTSVFQASLNRESFKAADGLKNILLDHFDAIMDSLEETLLDHASHDVFLQRLKSIESLKARDTARKWNEAMTKFTKELNDYYYDNYKKEFGATKKEPDSLKSDELAELSVFVESLKTMFTELDKVLDTIVE